MTRNWPALSVLTRPMIPDETVTPEAGFPVATSRTSPRTTLWAWAAALIAIAAVHKQAVLIFIA
ncbi:MAG: hypothetical protein ACYC2K_00670 [Gemmatimonadales bacterium]